MIVQISDAALNELNGEELGIYCFLLGANNVLNRTDLQNKAEFSREKVSKCLKSLEQKGFIKLNQSKTQAGQFSITYFEILK